CRSPYAYYQIPSVLLGDTIGPRNVLPPFFLCCSALTMATGLAWNLLSLLAFRFLFGAGEAGAFPNTSRSFSQWFPPKERGRAHGVIFMATRLGGALTPPLAIALIASVGWRASFWIFGSLGLFWSVAWWRWFRDDPAQHPAVNAEELKVIRQDWSQLKPDNKSHAIDFRRLLSANLLYVCLTYFAFGYGL